MTELDAVQEALAQRIAAAGRQALVERLRAAYADAASAHADVVSVSQERIEALVQAAADRADGLQWRRALATVAAGDLQIDLTQALSHPAVVRAQELIGAPSYEQSLADLISRPVPQHDGAQAVLEHEPVWEPAVIPGQEELFGEDPSPDLQETAEHHVSFDDADPGYPDLDYPGPEDDDDELRLSAHHLGGVANLPAGQAPLSLRLSPAGLDILGKDDAIIGRLAWEEIDQLEPVAPRGRLLRRDKGHAAILNVHTQHGDASFEIPAFSSVELQARLDPLIAKHGRH